MLYDVPGWWQDCGGVVSRKKRNQILHRPRSISGVLIAGVLLVATLNFAVEPSPVEARSITCPISTTSRLPTKSQFQALVASEPDYEGDSAQFNGARSGVWQVWAPISTRCQNLLGKGVYLYRAQWTITLQLSSGWPIGRDYSEDPNQIKDAFLQDLFGAAFYSEKLSNGFMDLYEPYGPIDQWDELSINSTSFWDGDLIPLTELCFAERCAFVREAVGEYTSITGSSIPYAAASINMCFPYTPLGAEGEAETELCTAFGQDKYAHPGTFGMQVRLSGTMTFEPLWTWRR